MQNLKKSFFFAFNMSHYVSLSTMPPPLPYWNAAFQICLFCLVLSYFPRLLLAFYWEVLSDLSCVQDSITCNQSLALQVRLVKQREDCKIFCFSDILHKQRHGLVWSKPKGLELAAKSGKLFNCSLLNWDSFWGIKACCGDQHEPESRGGPRTQQGS